ncbi:hypothetical protein [Romboutsia sp.]|uniref:hypothetical protein n=1 Tax=Romboutsia sp. TaxID=1965302 RepID=UPI003F364905
MNFKKIILFFSILLLLLCARLYTSSAEVYNQNFQIKNVAFKISLIETAYEMYNVNLNDSNSYEELYKNSSKEGYKHYKWLKNTYNSMDPDMKKKLRNIFEFNTCWNYINEVLELKDDASSEEIVNKIISSKNLNLNMYLKNDVDLFFNYFSTVYFDSYFNKYENLYLNRATNLNKIILNKNIDIIKFIENVSGLNLDKNYKLIFYYDFNPLQSQVFKNNNTIISTVQLDTSIQDLISIAFYQYSHYIFDNFKNNSDLLDVYDNLLSDKFFTSKYNKIGKDYYDFNIWCEENLIAGFSRYLDYRFFQTDSNFTSYAYDLDFYNYLRKINFNPKNKNLSDVCIDFYKNKMIQAPLN